MKPALFAIAFAFATLLSGCAVHSKQAIASVRAAGVSEPTVAKLNHRGILIPEDIIELSRRGVQDGLIIRHLEDVGVDYVVVREDVQKLRAAKVSREVISAFVVASDRWRAQRLAMAQRTYYYGAGYGYYYDPFDFDPWWWPQTSISLGYVGHWHHGDGHHHHR